MVSTSVGFMGGETVDPTYMQVATGKTGHAEVVQVVYDPKQIDYEALLSIYWSNVDSTPSSGAVDGFNSQYRSVIFTHSKAQAQLAHESKNALVAAKGSSETIITAIEPAGQFYRAAERHQNYYLQADE